MQSRNATFFSEPAIFYMFVY